MIKKRIKELEALTMLIRYHLEEYGSSIICLAVKFHYDMFTWSCNYIDSLGTILHCVNIVLLMMRFVHGTAIQNTSQWNHSLVMSHCVSLFLVLTFSIIYPATCRVFSRASKLITTENRLWWGIILDPPFPICQFLLIMIHTNLSLKKLCLFIFI